MLVSPSTFFTSPQVNSRLPFLSAGWTAGGFSSRLGDTFAEKHGRPMVITDNN